MTSVLLRVFGCVFLFVCLFVLFCFALDLVKSSRLEACDFYQCWWTMFLILGDSTFDVDLCVGCLGFYRTLITCNRKLPFLSFSLLCKHIVQNLLWRQALNQTILCSYLSWASLQLKDTGRVYLNFLRLNFFSSTTGVTIVSTLKKKIP